MTQYGFHLETLTIRGKGKEDATVEFKDGLNVIAGPSNTGKSYIFSCINFLLGESRPPKTIDAARGQPVGHRHPPEARPKVDLRAGT